jgi:hypothetical protein
MDGCERHWPQGSEADAHHTRRTLKKSRQESQAGLPDGLFSDQKSRFGYISGGLAMVDVDVLYGLLVYFVYIWSILWTFGLLYGHSVYFKAIFFPVFVIMY